jgi:iron complex outermembrane receptor protein
MVFLSLGPPAAVMAQPPPPVLDLKRLSLEELGEVVVTSVTKHPEQVWRTDAAIHVVTRQDIRRSGATSLPEALRLVPGVHVARIDTVRWAVGVRGFANQFSQSLLVLVDGRNVYTPTFAGVYWALQDLLLEDIERIEVIRGPGGTIWGTNAVNGVINVITRAAADTQGVYAAISAGNVDDIIGEVRYGGQGGDAFHYRVSARAFQRDAQHHPTTGPFDRWRMAHASVRADWTPTRRDAVTLDGRLFDGSEGKLTGIATYVPPAQTVVDAPDEVAGGHLLAAWRRTVKPGQEFRIQASYERTDRLGAQFGEIRDTIDVDAVDQRTVWGGHTLRWGGGARWSPSTFRQTIPTLDFQPRDRTHRVYSLFAQDEVPFAGGRGRATGGVKFEHNQYTGWEVQPTGRVLWAFSDRNSAWGAVSRAVRIPSRLDREIELNGNIAPEPPLYLRIAGNPAFDAERVVTYEAGWRRLFSQRVYVDAALFHNRYAGLSGVGAPSVFPENDPIRHTVVQVQFANAIEGTTTGFELTPTVTLTSWWSVRAAYSFLSPDLRNVSGISNPASVAVLEGSSPRHQGYVQSVVSIAPRVELQQTFRSVSALPGQLVPAYEALDLTGQMQISRNVEISAGVHNLLDVNHIEFGGDPVRSGMRRSVYVRLAWRP